MATLSQSKIKGEDQVIDPKLFLLYVFLVSVFMLFAGLTSAFIVSKGDKIWQNVTLPPAFTWSTILIVLSSVSMQMAFQSAKSNLISRNRVFLGITLLMGAGFMFSQYMGYKQLQESGFFLVGENTISSFVYLISGIHLAHIICAFLLVGFNLYQSFNYKIHSKSLNGIRICNTFWHFLGIVWVYLFLFFLYNNA